MMKLTSLLLLPTVIQGFGGLPELVSAAAHHGAAPSAAAASQVFDAYTTALKTNPLTTKVMTGGALAVCGDALAQSNSGEGEVYDKRRAASFCLFDGAYRALQHVAFPFLAAHCHGQYATSFLTTVGLPGVAQNAGDFLPAVEQTLSSQLGIVPFIYYPVFYALTGFVQGLTPEQALERAQTTFIPLMKRNLAFWIPVQFVQFEFVPTDLQIPFVCVCGLAWTCILSVAAGSAIKGIAASQERVSIAGGEGEDELQLTALNTEVVADARVSGEQQQSREMVGR